MPCASAGEEGRASLRPGCFHWRCPPLHRGPCTTRSIPTPPRPAPTPSTHKVNYHQHLFAKSYNLSSFQQFPIFFSTRNCCVDCKSALDFQIPIGLVKELLFFAFLATIPSHCVQEQEKHVFLLLYFFCLFLYCALLESQCIKV